MGASYGSGTFYLINPCVSLVIVYWVVILFLLPHLRPAHLPEIPIPPVLCIGKNVRRKEKKRKRETGLPGIYFLELTPYILTHVHMYMYEYLEKIGFFKVFIYDKCK